MDTKTTSVHRPPARVCFSHSGAPSQITYCLRFSRSIHDVWLVTMVTWKLCFVKTAVRPNTNFAAFDLTSEVGSWNYVIFDLWVRAAKRENMDVSVFIFFLAGISPADCEQPCWFHVSRWSRSWGDLPEFLFFLGINNSELNAALIWMNSDLWIHKPWSCEPKENTKMGRWSVWSFQKWGQIVM